MYNPNTGVWIENAKDDFTEHFETTYYLKYNIEKAIYSLEKIMKAKIDFSEFSNRCVIFMLIICLMQLDILGEDSLIIMLIKKG